MKEIFIKDVKETSKICDSFLVKQKLLNKAKNDKHYLALKLCDKTGEIEARVWDNAERLSSLFDQGDVILIKRGGASLYQKKLQIVIQDLEKVDKSDINMSDFIESSKFSSDEMLKELKGYFKRISNDHLRELLNLFFDDKGFTDAFCIAPAAKALHHSYLSGLLEHTLSVVKLITLLQENYSDLNMDLLLTGAVLHDIGKIKELSAEVGFDYTDPGRLLGHIVMGVEMIDNKIGQIKGFPPGLAHLLKHMVLSHHGIYEWGSPKKPKTLEALVLHYADDLDAKIMMFKNAVERDLRESESGWTTYNTLFERYLFKDAESYDEVAGTKEESKAEQKEKPSLGQFSMFED